MSGALSPFIRRERIPRLPGKSRRPNVLLITCDQWRGDCLSAAGHPVVKTPNADALAAEGVLFRRHYGGAAPCSPARACLYTGLYQMNNRVCRNGTPLDARHDNIALSARSLGYDPTLFGYTDVSPDPRTLPPGDPRLKSYEGVLPGFTVRQLLPEHQKPWLSWLKARGVDASAGVPGIHRPVDEALDTRGSDGVTSAPPIYSKDETPAAFLTGEFVRWLGEQEPDAPWFAHLSFISPHPPFIVPEPYNTMYDPADGPAFRRAESWQAEAGSHPYLGYDLDRQQRSKFRPGAEGKVRDWGDDNFRRIRALYYGMISEVDAQLGRIWQSVKASGALGRHRHRADLRPCRDDGRPFHAGQGRLLRRKFSYPADHPRPAPWQNCRLRRRSVHRGGGHSADAARPVQ